MTRWKIPTLKKSIHFSWALISLRTVDADCGLQVVQSTLSQVRLVMLLYKQGCEAAGVLEPENICT